MGDFASNFPREANEVYGDPVGAVGDIVKYGSVRSVAGGAARGAAQGVANVGQGVQDIAIGTANLGPLAYNHTAGRLGAPKSGYIPSPDWAKDAFVDSSLYNHDYSKSVGAEGFFGLTGAAAAKAATRAACAPKRTVIGKVKDLDNLAPVENTLLKHLPDQGTPKANWQQNSSVLRQEISKGNPIRDASLNADGTLKSYPGSFLEAERNLLRNQGWSFDSSTSLWNPAQ